MKKILLTSALALLVTTAIVTAEDTKPEEETTKAADIKSESGKDEAKAVTPGTDTTKPARKRGHHHRRHHHEKVDRKSADAATEMLSKQTGLYVAPMVDSATAPHMETPVIVPTISVPTA